MIKRVAPPHGTTVSTAAFVVFLLSGCATPPPSVPVTEHDAFAETMSKYAASVSDSLSKMQDAEGSNRILMKEPAKKEVTPISLANLTPTPEPFEEPARYRGFPSTSSAAEVPARQVLAAIPQEATPTRGVILGDRREVPPPRYLPEEAPEPMLSAPVVRPLTQPQPVAPAAVGTSQGTVVNVYVSSAAGTPIPGSVVQPVIGAGSSIVSSIPPGLEVRLSTPWHHSGEATGFTGSLENIVSRVCRETGWAKGSSIGLPIAPIRLSLNADNRPAYEVLDEIGNDVGRSATIRISVEKRTISIEYPVR